MNQLIEISNLATSVKILHAKRIENDGTVCDIAVILHLYYFDLWDEIRSYFANLGSDFDLYVTVCDTTKESDVELIKKHYPKAFVCKLENRGRDIGPFLEIYPVIANYYRYICKIHSKKSQHRSDGAVWRQRVYEELLGSPKRIKDIKWLFNRFTEIGIVGPKGYVVRCRDNLGENSEKIIVLAKILGAKNIERFDYEFPAGSMFWFRPDAIAALLDLKLHQDNFENEQMQLDGTLAHAVERVLPLASSVAGYTTVDTHLLEIIKELFGADWHHSPLYLDGSQAFSAALSIAKSSSRINVLNQIVDERDKQIDSIYRSTSWRITQPLRFIVNHFKPRS